MGELPEPIHVPPIDSAEPRIDFAEARIEIGVSPIDSVKPPTGSGEAPIGCGLSAIELREAPTGSGEPRMNSGKARSALALARKGSGKPPKPSGEAPSGMGIAAIWMGASPMELGLSAIAMATVPAWLGRRPSGRRGLPLGWRRPPSGRGRSPGRGRAGGRDLELRGEGEDQEPEAGHGPGAGRRLHLRGHGAALQAGARGTWDGARPRTRAAKLAGATAGPYQLSTDGWGAYPGAIERHLGGRVNYAQFIKTFSGEEQDSERRYSPPSIIASEKRAIAGEPDRKRVCTSHIERENLYMRMQLRRFTRLTNAFSRKRENLKAALALHFAAFNTLRITPAMKAGLVRKPWTVEDLLLA